MKIKTLFTLAFIFTFLHTTAQLELIGQYRARAEFSNGYNQPLTSAQDPAFYVQQRARLGVKYSRSLFEFNFTAQDVRVWGNTSHLALDNNGLLSIYEANVSMFFTPRWSLKIGRQPISYDNQRIFGGLDWAMQARRHDAGIVSYRDSTWSVDVGASYNQMSAANHASFYTLNNYKTFQYAWVHKEWKQVKASLLFLNNGNEHHFLVDSVETKKIRYSQTLGGQVSYDYKDLNLLAYGYYQFGKTKDNRELSAYNASLTASYKVKSNFSIALGGEILSGTHQLASANDRNTSFSPLYGTNHGFNGFMDYFYVGGQHENSVGVIDGYLKLNYKPHQKVGLSLHGHAFFSAARTFPTGTWLQIISEPSQLDPMGRYMGTELDFTVSYQFADEVSIQAGYSHIFGSRLYRDVKGLDRNIRDNYVYVMVTVLPFKNLKL